MATVFTNPALIAPLTVHAPRQAISDEHPSGAATTFEPLENFATDSRRTSDELPRLSSGYATPSDPYDQFQAYPTRGPAVAVESTEHIALQATADRQQSDFATPTNPQEEFHAYPERGTKAWLVVLGAWCAMVPPIGMMNSLGVLHAWIGSHQLEHYGESTVGWIFSVHAFFAYIASSQLGAVFDRYGVRSLVIAGSIGYITMLFSLSFCSQLWHFILSFGVLGGLSASCLFTPSVCAVGHWFSKRRGLATGIAYTSGSLGGIVFPLLMLYLAPVIGYAWTIRIIGFVSAALFLIACILLDSRLVPESKMTIALDFKGFREPAFTSTVLAVFLVEFAIFIPLTYLSSYAIHIGMSPPDAYRLIVYLNVGSVPGRMLPGYFADRFGHFNVMIVTTSFCSIFIFSLWLFCGANSAAIIAFAFLFGFWSGASISLTPVCVAQVCRIEDYGKRNGTAYSLSSFAALIGVPIAGALVDVQGGDYKGLICFGGGLYGATMLAFVLARFFAGKALVVPSTALPLESMDARLLRQGTMS